MTSMKSDGQLEWTLRAGHFAVTAEITPPLSADSASMLERASPLKGLVDAVNVTEGARTHLSSLAAASQLVGAGLEPVLQIDGRDRKKLLLERDILGAAALGVPNILALRGDPITKGDEPEATEVPDLGAADIVQVTKHMRTPPPYHLAVRSRWRRVCSWARPTCPWSRQPAGNRKACSGNWTPGRTSSKRSSVSTQSS